MKFKQSVILLLCMLYYRIYLAGIFFFSQEHLLRPFTWQNILDSLHGKVINFNYTTVSQRLLCINGPGN